MTKLFHMYTTTPVHYKVITHCVWLDSVLPCKVTVFSLGKVFCKLIKKKYLTLSCRLGIVCYYEEITTASSSVFSAYELPQDSTERNCLRSSTTSASHIFMFIFASAEQKTFFISQAPNPAGLLLLLLPWMTTMMMMMPGTKSSLIQCTHTHSPVGIRSYSNLISVMLFGADIQQRRLYLERTNE